MSTELHDPYDFAFQPTAEGTYLLKAMVTTDLGVYESSAEIVVEARVNTAPAISELSNLSVREGGNSGQIEFTIGGAETSSDSLLVEAT